MILNFKLLNVLNVIIGVLILQYTYITSQVVSKQEIDNQLFKISKLLNILLCPKFFVVLSTLSLELKLAYLYNVRVKAKITQV